MSVTASSAVHETPAAVAEGAEAFTSPRSTNGLLCSVIEKLEQQEVNCDKGIRALMGLMASFIKGFTPILREDEEMETHLPPQPDDDGATRATPTDMRAELLERITAMQRTAEAHLSRMAVQHEDAINGIDELLVTLREAPGWKRDEATKDLALLAAETEENADAVLRVTHLLSRGANCHDTYTLSGTVRRPALHTMISRGMLAAVQAVMAHQQPVDLTVLDGGGRSALHVLASACPGEDEVVTEMLAAVLTRYQDPSLTIVVDWEQPGTCAGEQRLDFLSAVAAQGRLSVLFPELIAAKVPHYDDRQDFTLPLKVSPQREDWQRLREIHRKAFASFKAEMQQIEPIRACRIFFAISNGVRCSSRKDK